MNTTTSMQTNLQHISLDNILIWDKNPRKHIDTKALNELADNIKSFEVLEPIIIRPVPQYHPLASENKYFIIAGERRFRASSIAGKTEIPSIVKNVDDKTALEIAITENYLREDVHPLDEAEAFNTLIQEGSNTNDLALKFGIGEPTVIQRLKLVELLPEIKKLFYSNHLKIGHAILICRLKKEQQKECLNYLKDSVRNNEFTTVSNLRSYIESNIYMQLDKAPFDIQNDCLIKKCGACTLCSKRSGANKLLFDEVQQGDICLDRKCFENKIEAHLDSGYLAAVNDGLNIIAGWAYGEEKAQIKDRFPGVLFINDDYFISNKNGGVKAFVVEGTDAGKYKYIKLNKTKNDNGKGLPVEPSVKEQIEKIEGRIIRNRELDEEKIYTVAIEKAKTIKFKAIKSLSSDSAFGQIFTLFLLESGRANATEAIYNGCTGKKKALGWMHGKEVDKVIDQYLKEPGKLNDEIFNIFIQELISRYGSAKNAPHIGKRIMNFIFNQYSIEIGYPEIRKPFLEKAALREERHNKMLTALKATVKGKPKSKKAKKAKKVK